MIAIGITENVNATAKLSENPNSRVILNVDALCSEKKLNIARNKNGIASEGFQGERVCVMNCGCNSIRVKRTSKLFRISVFFLLSNQATIPTPQYNSIPVMIVVYSEPVVARKAGNNR